MAKNWNYENGMLVRNFSEKKSEVVEFTIEMELKGLFEEFAEFEEVQQLCIVNGLKQKIDDNLARPKELALTVTEQYTETVDLWKQLIEGRKWNKTERAGSGKGESVSLKLIVDPLRKAGLSEEAIRGVLLSTGKKM